MAAPSPILHILAGPNGAGKTTLYEAQIRPITDAPFVNADRLALEALGRYALTRQEAELGQDLANARRDMLMAAGESLVTESTFSHPSKLELIHRAKALGYRVFVYHVNVVSADFAVARVVAREAKGGHPVPEANIRGRYERNQPLIREAVLMADRARVFDNSVLGQAPRQVISFVSGQAKDVALDLPAWASALYCEDLA
jgi:predicted ABC-type ATPase